MASLGILSQNMASESTGPSEKFTPSMPHSVLVICRQEVRDPDNANLVPESYLSENKLVLRSEVALNDISKNTKQNVKILVYTKHTPYLIEKGVIPISAKAGVVGVIGNIYQGVAGYSKGAAWTKLNIDYHTSFLFVNVHLPMDKHAPGLGVDYRTSAFKTLLTNLLPHVTENTYLFITGDLNFRMDEAGKNQLNDLLAMDTLPISLTDISPPSEKQYTCKFNPTSTTECRMQKIIPGNTPRDPSCFDEKRIPSRCDRVLVGDKNLELLKYETFVIGSKFDHNGIYSVFRLPEIKKLVLLSHSPDSPPASPPASRSASPPASRSASRSASPSASPSDSPSASPSDSSSDSPPATPRAIPPTTPRAIPRPPLRPTPPATPRPIPRPPLRPTPPASRPRTFRKNSRKNRRMRRTRKNRF